MASSDRVPTEQMFIVSVKNMNIPALKSVPALKSILGAFIRPTFLSRFYKPEIKKVS